MRGSVVVAGGAYARKVRARGITHTLVRRIAALMLPRQGITATRFTRSCKISTLAVTILRESTPGLGRITIGIRTTAFPVTFRIDDAVITAKCDGRDDLNWAQRTGLTATNALFHEGDFGDKSTGKTTGDGVDVRGDLKTTLPCVLNT
jgi:hypothetical protein